LKTTATSKAGSKKTVPIDKLVLVLPQGKQTVNFPFAAGIANEIVSQINNSIVNQTTPKFSINIGHYRIAVISNSGLRPNLSTIDPAIGEPITWLE
jgi:hypothetical protein